VRSPSGFAMPALRDAQRSLFAVALRSL